jgi:glucose/mannose-6-phosphate isomerase
MSFTHRISSGDLHRIDKSDMAGHISRMGTHIRDAVQLCGALTLPISGKECSGAVVLGMGGSAIGGDLVRSYLSGKLSVPITINRSYELPSYANEKTLIIASSYSGNTEETLSAFEQAVAKKLPILCITTGGTLAKRAKELNYPLIIVPAGMQPRAALAYSVVPILLALEKLGMSSGEAQNLERAATLLDTISERYGTEHLDENNPAFKLAGNILHRVPVVYAASDYDTVGIRWRGQIQENGKHLAFANVLPEMNHNELEGWTNPVDLVERFSILLLRSTGEHPRIAKRFEVMKDIFRSKQVDVFELASEGETHIEQMFSLIILADWTSYYMALFAGTDPTAIEAIDQFKQKMG